MKKIFATEDNIHVVAQVDRLLHFYVGLCCINFSDHKTLWSTRQPTHHIAQHPNPRYAGLIAWSAFEYASLLNGYHAVKVPRGSRCLPDTEARGRVLTLAGRPERKARHRAKLLLGLRSSLPRGARKASGYVLQLRAFEGADTGQPLLALHPDSAVFPHLKYLPFYANLEADDLTNPNRRGGSDYGDPHEGWIHLTYTVNPHKGSGYGIA